MTVSKPLPERIRPDELNQFIGQVHLRQKIDSMLQAKRLPSLLFFGPPGCGKSTIAILLAKAKGTNVLRISAPETGLQHLRRNLNGVDILILDELHRFSKSQQDFFLPLVESGELTLLATTTENPSFSVTRQLLSRLHVLRLKILSHSELMEIGKRGIVEQNIELTDDILNILADVSHGDARVMLNLIEYVAGLPADKRTIENIKVSLPEIIARHDKSGDSHYELASALIKSIRGSDPDAALYYLACFLEGGEDPRFICRRLILLASEDIGLADSHALTLAVSCQQAIEFVGMPEGFIPLAHTVVYLSLAPKSNSTYVASINATREVKTNGIKSVPIHLRNPSTKLHKEWGYGKEYKYPHNYEQGWIKQEYLPHELKDKCFYRPKTLGDESRLSQNWKRNTKD